MFARRGRKDQQARLRAFLDPLAPPAHKGRKGHKGHKGRKGRKGHKGQEVQQALKDQPVRRDCREIQVRKDRKAIPEPLEWMALMVQPGLPVHRDQPVRRGRKGCKDQPVRREIQAHMDRRAPPARRVSRETREQRGPLALTAPPAHKGRVTSGGRQIGTARELQSQP